ncbi:MAG: alpha/beta fold hydrolase [bacterium]
MDQPFHYREEGRRLRAAAGKFAQLDGVRLAYGTLGERGTPVLLVMGYTVPGSAWVHQVPALSAHHRVAWYDHRGCGATEAAPGAYSMRLLASDAERLLDHLGWDTAHVVGVSMGGMVSQELALRARRRIRSLTLIATHAGGMVSRVPPWAGLKRFVHANLAPRSQRFEILKRLLFPDDFLARCDQEWLEWVLRNDFGTPIPTRYRLSQLAAVMRHDTRRRVGQLRGLPTLVVGAGRDALVQPAACERLHRLLPGSRFHVFQEAGHAVIRQCYAALNELLLEHFAAADRARSG